MGDPITLDNIDELIERWQKECDDLDPHNVDSCDRCVEPSVHTSCHAICLLPEVLRQLKAVLEASRPGGMIGKLLRWCKHEDTLPR